MANEKTSDTVEDINNLVALERLQNLYHDSKVVSFTALFTSILMGLMLWSIQTHTLVIAWFAVHIIIAFWRGVFLHRLYRHRINQLDSAQAWVRHYAFVALISGFVWASLPWVMLDLNSPYNVSAIVIVMFGMVAASNVALSAYPTAFFCFALPALCGLFFRFINEGGDYIYVSIMLIAFVFFNIIQSIRIFKMITASIQQRFENIELMRNLEIKKQEADKANLDKSRFLAATSHDLRQPLHALDLYLGALALEVDKQPQQDILSKARTSSQSVSELLNALLDISRLDAQEVPVNLQSVHISKLLKAVQSEWHPQLEEFGRELEVDAIDLCIKTDPILLTRILGNIIANALKHTSGDVLMHSTKHDNNICIEICDEGEGIPEDSLHEVFTEYFQLNNPERDRTKGLGLGLAIVKRLALLLQHPTQIKNMEQGLCFSIEAPICKAEQTSNISAFDEVKSLEDLDCFILVIDDEEAIRDSIQLLLRGWGCEVFIAESSHAAITKMERDNYPTPDIIVSDYRLREHQVGTDALLDIQSFFKASIPAIIVTGDKDNTIVEQCQTLDIPLLYKPVSPSTLKRTIQSLLAKQV
ncbi:MAG: hybrid sensor histidine kinase/response regulator [Ghiorsea sp.]|nr:hybrid sensor histidine kinase/response regulator [Ghiorsea sp.]